MRKQNFLIYYSFSLIIILTLFISCKGIRESQYTKYNQVGIGFYQYFSNDSLQFEINFRGGHTILNPPLKNFNEFTSPALVKYLKKDLQFSLRPSLLLFSHPDWKMFGYQYIGFIQDKSSFDLEAKVSESQSPFFEMGPMEQVENYLLKKYIIPLSEHNLVLYCFYKLLSDTKTDSSRLINTSLSELMSLNSTIHYKHLKGEKSFIDSAFEIADLPGYGTPLNRLTKLKSETTNNQDQQLISQFLYTVHANMDEVDTIRQMQFEQRTFKGNTRTVNREDTLEVHKQLAVNKVFDVAGRNKILMINESHYD